MCIYNFLQFSIYWEGASHGTPGPVAPYLLVVNFFFNYLVYLNINLGREFDQ